MKTYLIILMILICCITGAREKVGKHDIRLLSLASGLSQILMV